MRERIHPIAAWLYRRAENFLVLLLAVMFVSFLIQIAFRYLLNFPIGWTSETTVITWLWLVLWGAAFVLREDEEIRFDLIYGAASPVVRRIMTLIASLALLIAYIFSYPAVFDYVTFMRIQETAYLDIRFDYLFSIYLMFAAAVIVRYLFIFHGALRNYRETEKVGGSNPIE